MVVNEFMLSSSRTREGSQGRDEFLVLIQRAHAYIFASYQCKLALCSAGLGRPFKEFCWRATSDALSVYHSQSLLVVHS